MKNIKKGALLMLAVIGLIFYALVVEKNTPKPISKKKYAPLEFKSRQVKDARAESYPPRKSSYTPPLSNECPAQNKVRYLVQTETRLLYSKRQDWLSHEAELRKHMLELSSDELKKLGDDVLLVTNPPDERRVSIYLLTLAGVPAREVLAKIARSPIPKFANLGDPHSSGNLQLHRERSLRASALEALDRLAAQKSKEVYLDLQNILAQQSDDSLKFFAKISLVGISQGKPGKLSRWLAQNVNSTKESSL